MSRSTPYVLMQFVLVACLTVGLAFSVKGAFLAQAQPASSGESAQSLPVKAITQQSGLEVKDAQGEPVPLDSPLQGVPGSAQQKAAGSLQTPKTTDELQPNARLSDFPSEL